MMIFMAPASPDPLGVARYAPMIQDGEKYAHVEDNGVLRVQEHPVSTFSIDVAHGIWQPVGDPEFGIIYGLSECRL